MSRPPRGTQAQTDAFYTLLRAICAGDDVPESHILKELNLGPWGTGKRVGAWFQVEELHDAVGNWEHVLKQTYNSYLHSGIRGARGALAILCLEDEQLADLLKSHPEDTHVFPASVVGRSEKIIPIDMLRRGHKKHGDRH